MRSEAHFCKGENRVIVLRAGKENTTHKPCNYTRVEHSHVLAGGITSDAPPIADVPPFLSSTAPSARPTAVSPSPT